MLKSFLSAGKESYLEHHILFNSRQELKNKNFSNDIRHTSKIQLIKHRVNQRCVRIQKIINDVP